MIFPQHFLNVIYLTIESSSKFIFYIHLFRYTHDCKSSFTSHYEPTIQKTAIVQRTGQGNRWNVGKRWYVLPVLREHAQELFKMQRYEDGKAESTKWLNPFYRSPRQFGWRLTTRSRKWRKRREEKKLVIRIKIQCDRFNCKKKHF